MWQDSLIQHSFRSPYDPDRELQWLGKTLLKPSPNITVKKKMYQGRCNLSLLMHLKMQLSNLVNRLNTLSMAKKIYKEMLSNILLFIKFKENKNTLKIFLFPNYNGSTGILARIHAMLIWENKKKISYRIFPGRCSEQFVRNLSTPNWEPELLKPPEKQLYSEDKVIKLYQCKLRISEKYLNFVTLLIPDFK